MKSFEFTSCDNLKCKSRDECKRFVMWNTYEADDVKRGGGDATKNCGRYLPMKNHESKK